jgi:hypothetical protein
MEDLKNCDFWKTHVLVQQPAIACIDRSGSRLLCQQRREILSVWAAKTLTFLLRPYQDPSICYVHPHLLHKQPTLHLIFCQRRGDSRSVPIASALTCWLVRLCYIKVNNTLSNWYTSGLVYQIFTHCSYRFSMTLYSDWFFRNIPIITTIQALMGPLWALLSTIFFNRVSLCFSTLDHYYSINVFHCYIIYSRFLSNRLSWFFLTLTVSNTSGIYTKKLHILLRSGSAVLL